VGGGEGSFRVERGDEVVLPGFPQLALREDRAANVAGAELFGFARAGGADGSGGLEEAAGHTGVLFVLGDELADAAGRFGAGASLFVYVGHHLSPAARNAHFVLPAATFAEMEGSFTNHQPAGAALLAGAPRAGDGAPRLADPGRAAGRDRRPRAPPAPPPTPSRRWPRRGPSSARWLGGAGREGPSSPAPRPTPRTEAIEPRGTPPRGPIFEQTDAMQAEPRRTSTSSATRRS
jgi:hypothetical protein